MNRSCKNRLGFTNGSALILVVVLMSILATIGVLFLMASRIDELSTKSVIQEKDLDSAVESIVAKLSNELVLDTPGVLRDASGKATSEYYDYPDSNNMWLANLEPYDQDGNPATTTDIYWGQISDLTGYLQREFGINTVQHVSVRARKADGTYRNFLPEHLPIGLNSNGDLLEQSADADGDGVADSKWIELEDVSSSTGKRLYAAIRVIDNGGMINVNTAYKFDNSTIDPRLVDGSKVTQINMMSVFKGTTDDPEKIHEIRCDNEFPAPDLITYNDECAIRLDNPDRASTNYLPYDISDELELRYRFIIDNDGSLTRIETAIPITLTFNNGKIHGNKMVPFDANLSAWAEMMNKDSGDRYNFRHILTEYNADRIINPNGDTMININDINNTNIAQLYANIRQRLVDANNPSLNVDRIAAQLAVNMIDYRDSDTDATVYNNPDDGIDYYGFEAQPFISEIASIIDATDPTLNVYALELYNPFDVNIPLDDFVISISSGVDIPLSGQLIYAKGYFVISNDLSKFTVNTTNTMTDSNLRFSDNYTDTDTPPDGVFNVWTNYNITLKRTVGITDLILDFQNAELAWFAPTGIDFSAQRNTNNWQVVYQTIETSVSKGTLGAANSTLIPGAHNYNLYIANKNFITVGDALRALIIGPGVNTIGQQLTSAVSESDIRIDLSNADFEKILNSFTIFAPPAAAGNMKLYGRININTAPAFVLAQLPWMQYKDSTLLERANAVCDYRDTVALGFKSVGELMQINEMKTLDSDGDDNLFSAAVPNNGPDLTDDTAQDDFEERDLIFSRISNLVTVRSDVFTAYILVRLGADGPQKRMIAILDRSNVYKGNDKVKIIALHPVADPR